MDAEVNIFELQGCATLVNQYNCQYYVTAATYSQKLFTSDVKLVSFMFFYCILNTLNLEYGTYFGHDRQKVLYENKDFIAFILFNI